jgi:intracellular sulfur oxidation DsrE/DsrF family protein
MKFRTFLQAGMLVGAAMLAPVTFAQASVAATKVVIQVSDGDAAKWNLALNNAKNAQQELGADKVQIEIVAYGPGIGMLKEDATTKTRVSEAVKSGIQIVACENTMKGQKLTKADMNPAVGYVPAGVVELIKRQGEGWAYIHP